MGTWRSSEENRSLGDWRANEPDARCDETGLKGLILSFWAIPDRTLPGHIMKPSLLQSGIVDTSKVLDSRNN